MFHTALFHRHRNSGIPLHWGYTVLGAIHRYRGLAHWYRGLCTVPEFINGAPCLRLPLIDAPPSVGAATLGEVPLPAPDVDVDIDVDADASMPAYTQLSVCTLTSVYSVYTVQCVRTVYSVYTDQCNHCIH